MTTTLRSMPDYYEPDEEDLSTTEAAYAEGCYVCGDYRWVWDIRSVWVASLVQIFRGCDLSKVNFVYCWCVALLANIIVEML